MVIVAVLVSGGGGSGDDEGWDRARFAPGVKYARGSSAVAALALAAPLMAWAAGGKEASETCTRGTGRVPADGGVAGCQ